MSNTFGALYIQGQQINLPGGPQGIGTYAIPASGIQYTIECQCVASVLFTQPIPGNVGGVKPTGVLLIPPVGNASSIITKWNFGDSGGYINPEYPSWFTFDPNNLVADLYILCSASMTITLQFV